MFDRIIDPLTRDFNELLNAGPFGWLILAALVLFPVLAVTLMLGRSRLAAWSPALYLAVWVELVIYYGTGYRGNLGLGRELLIHALPMLVAWILLGVAALRVLLRRARRGASIGQEA
jgi:hypothetical protein